MPLYLFNTLKCIYRCIYIYIFRALDCFGTSYWRFSKHITHNSAEWGTDIPKRVRNIYIIIIKEYLHKKACRKSAISWPLLRKTDLHGKKLKVCSFAPHLSQLKLYLTPPPKSKYKPVDHLPPNSKFLWTPLPNQNTSPPLLPPKFDRLLVRDPNWFRHN